MTEKDPNDVTMNVDVTMSFDDLQEHTRRLLKAARAELARIDRERAEFIDRIEQLEVLLGERRLAGKGRRARISTSTLKNDVIDVLSAAPNKQLSAANVLKSLVSEHAYPNSRSMRTRLYATLSKWSAASDTVERVGRGQYRLL